MRSAVVCLLAALVGCGSDPPITAVRIVVQYDASTRFDQFDFWLDLDEGLSAPITRPEEAGAPLSAPQDLVLYVPDSWAGTQVFCRARGLRNRQGIATSLQRPVTVVLHQTVSCEVTLGLIGGAMDAAPP
jgi:hypothetical protein